MDDFYGPSVTGPPAVGMPPPVRAPPPVTAPPPSLTRMEDLYSASSYEPVRVVATKIAITCF